MATVCFGVNPDLAMLGVAGQRADIGWMLNTAAAMTRNGECDLARLRLLGVETLAEFLADAGFEIEAQFGWWFRHPLDLASPQIVTVSRV